MKQFIFLVVLCLSAISAESQSSSPPVSTIRRTLNRNRVDTIQVNSLLNLSRYYIFKPGEQIHDLDTALLMIQQSRSLSQSLYYQKGMGNADFCSYLAWLEKGDHRQAILYAERAIDRFTRYGYWQLLGALYLEMTRLYTLDLDELPYKIDCYQKALLSFQRAGDKAKQIDVYKELADHHQVLENYAQALAELQNALTLSRQIGRTDLERIYDLLGFVSTKFGDYKEGLTYGLLAVKLAEERKNSTIQLCTIYNRLGLTYYALGQFKQANNYYRKSLRIARQFHETPYVLALTSNIAKLLLHQNKPQQALRFLKSQIEQYPPTTAESKLIVAPLFLDIYAELNQFKLAHLYCDQVLDLLAKKGDGSVGRAPIYESAIRFLITSKQFTRAHYYLQLNAMQCRKNGSTKDLSRNHLLWFKLDSSQANYQAAILHYQRYEALQDSLLNATKSQQIAQLEIQYETQKKDQNIKLKQQAIQLLTKQSQLQQNQLQQANTIRNGIIAGTILLILLLGLGFNRYQLKQHSNQLLETKQIEINRKNHDLERIVQEKDNLLIDKEQLLIDKDHLLEEREWMLKEMHHRVKNNLQIITSLLHSQGSYLKDKEALSAIRESQNRVHAMALLHQKLYQTDRLSSIPMVSYIQEIVDYLINSFNRVDTIRKKITVAPIDLDVTYAVPLGLILNEAVTNSLKYAFPDGRIGTICIDLIEVKSKTYRLVIGDDGVGFPADLNPSRSRTLGMSLIRGLSEQIEGILDISQHDGVRISLTFVEEKNARVPA
jgi:two-component sensor histidine kinase